MIVIYQLASQDNIAKLQLLKVGIHHMIGPLLLIVPHHHPHHLHHLHHPPPHPPHPPHHHHQNIAKLHIHTPHHMNLVMNGKHLRLGKHLLNGRLHHQPHLKHHQLLQVQ